MSLIVSGYVDGDPVYFEEPKPTYFEATAEVEEKPSYEVQISAEDEHGNLGLVHNTIYVQGTWIEPVWQRTEADVEYALRLNNKIVQYGWSSLTSQEQANWAAGLIGCLNAWDLNRIEIDTDFLRDLLLVYGYSAGITTIKVDWDVEDLLESIELERLRANIQNLIDSYYSPEITGTQYPMPENMQKLNYKVLNNIENNLRLMKEMIHRMEESFRYCGTFYCGQEVAL